MQREFDAALLRDDYACSIGACTAPLKFVGSCRGIFILMPLGRRRQRTVQL